MPGTLQAEENGSYIAGIDNKLFFIWFATTPVTTVSRTKTNMHIAHIYYMLDNGINIILFKNNFLGNILAGELQGLVSV